MRIREGSQLQNPVLSRPPRQATPSLRGVFMCLAAFWACFTVSATVVINEVQSSNDKTCTDERGEAPDWVELYNSGESAVKLGGWVLTDKEDKPAKWWYFPKGTSIEPKGYLMVYADSTGVAGPADGGDDEEDAPVVKDTLEPNDDSIKANLVAWYRADDLSSTAGSLNWKDQSGRGNNAELAGSSYPSIVSSAVNGHKALKFNVKNDQRISIPLRNTDFGMTNMKDATVIIIANWDGSFASTTQSKKYAGLFDVSHKAVSVKSGRMTTTKRYDTYFQVYNSGDLQAQTGDATTPQHKLSSAVTKNTWCALTLMAESADLESPRQKVYVNDMSKGAQGVSGLDQTTFGTSSVMYLGSSQYQLGTDGNRSSAGYYFGGQIAEVIIYNRALTDEEYKKVYKALANKYNLPGGAGAGSEEVKKGLHTSFGLSASGDALALIDIKNGSNTVDRLDFGKIPCDCSYGRMTDGGETLKWFAKPTPNAMNADEDSPAYEEPLGDIVFSQKRGIYSEPFELTLTYKDDPDVKIYYTLDRDEPTTESTLYKGPIAIGKTTIVRATAFKEGHLPYRNVTTHTYIFLDQVASQDKPNNTYPDKWGDTVDRSYKETVASYKLSTSVLKTERDKTNFVAALKAIPIVSVTLPDDALFNSADGLYIHPTSMKDREPVQADVEWVTGSDTFGSGVGLDMHGAYSRRFDITAKKSFSLKFRSRFGASSLDHNVLADGGGEAVAYKTLILRGENNHAWTSMESTNYGGHPELGQSMVDQFMRNTQKAMSGYQAEGTHVHLFLNGMYWGLYNLTDHVNDSFAAATWCTDEKPEDRMDLRENFDVIKNLTSSPYYVIRDGSDAEYKKLKNEIGASLDSAEKYAAMSNRFDYAAYIDMLLIEWFAANEDWPGNNWVACCSTNLCVPFRYVLWDSDKSVRVTSQQKDPGYDLTGNTDSSGAMMFHNKLKASTKGKAEYTLMFADRIQKHLIDKGGALTVESVTNRYMQLANKVEKYVFAESARWGAYLYDNWDSLTYKPQQTKFDSPFDLTWWTKERDRLTKTWFPERHPTLIAQLKTAGFWSDALANVSTIMSNDDDRTVTLSIPSGTGVKVYYTLDGSDPRQMFTGGAVGTAYASGTKIALPEEGGVLKVRVLNGTTWSALTELEFDPVVETRNVFVSEEGKDATWTKDSSWSLGYYPNAAGAIAVVGVPMEVSKKNQRKIAINNGTGVTVGQLEFTNGGHINNIESGKTGGDLHFCGEDGEDATVMVLDEATAGHAVIELDEPWAVRLESDVAVTVSNTVGNAEFGGMVIGGAIAGSGHNIAKWGPGRLTLAATNVTGDVFGNLQCNEGVLAVETPLRITSVTKADTIWLPPCVTSSDEAFAASVVCSEKLNNTKVGLFVPTTWGDDETEFFGGVLTTKGKKDTLTPGEVTIYVLDDEGDVTFCGQQWSAYDTKAETGTPTGKPTREVVDLPIDNVVYQTFKVKIPYFGPKSSITFDSNGGSAVDPIEADVGASVEAPASPTRTGYTFAGWFAPSAEEPYVFTVMPAGGVQLTAHWRANVYHVVFDANGGSGEAGARDAAYDEEFDAPSDGLERAGYTFMGWALSRDGEVVYQVGDKIKNLTEKSGVEVTLYAVWKSLHPTIDDDQIEETVDVELAVGEEKAFTRTFRKNLRFWLLGSPDGFACAEAELGVASAATDEYEAYVVRSTDKTNEVTVTIRGVKAGESVIYLGRQYKLKAPCCAVRFRVNVK